MLNSKLHQKGFSALEALLILIIVAIIGFVGWFVWDSKQEVDKSSSNPGNSATTASKNKNNIKQTEADKLTANWKSFSAEGDIYSLRVADGWEFSFYNPTTLSGAPSAELAGKPATVTTVQGGRDGFVGFSAAYDETTTKRSFAGYTEDGVAHSKELDGKRYTRVSTGGSGVGLEKDTVTHAYYFVKGSHGYYFSYSFSPDETDLTTTAEQMIATATFK